MGSGCTASLLSEHSVFLLVLTWHCGSHSFQARPRAFLALQKDSSHAGIQNFTGSHSDLTLVISDRPAHGVHQQVIKCPMFLPNTEFSMWESHFSGYEQEHLALWSLPSSGPQLGRRIFSISVTRTSCSRNKIIDPMEHSGISSLLYQKPKNPI